jgi:hypothetical protein
MYTINALSASSDVDIPSVRASDRRVSPHFSQRLVPR